jgi:hypothetical protein
MFLSRSRKSWIRNQGYSPQRLFDESQGARLWIVIFFTLVGISYCHPQLLFAHPRTLHWNPDRAVNRHSLGLCRAASTGYGDHCMRESKISRLITRAYEAMEDPALGLSFLSNTPNR